MLMMLLQVLGKNGHLPHVAPQQTATRAEQPQQPAWPEHTCIPAAHSHSSNSSSSKPQAADLSGGYESRHAAAAGDLWARLTGPHKRPQGGGRGRDIDALAQDMQALDTDIASLEATLHSAGL